MIVSIYRFDGLYIPEFLKGERALPDISDFELRRTLQDLGFRGSNLPLRLASKVDHPNLSGAEEIRREGESRREALSRLKEKLGGNKPN